MQPSGFPTPPHPSSLPTTACINPFSTHKMVGFLIPSHRCTFPSPLCLLPDSSELLLRRFTTCKASCLPWFCHHLSPHGVWVCTCLSLCLILWQNAQLMLSLHGIVCWQSKHAMCFVLFFLLFVIWAFCLYGLHAACLIQLLTSQLDSQAFMMKKYPGNVVKVVNQLLSSKIVQNGERM